MNLGGDSTRRQQRKTHNVLRMKKEAKEQRIKEIKEKQSRMLEKERLKVEKEQKELENDVSSKRHLDFYAKVFKQKEESEQPNERPQKQPKDDSQAKRTREEWQKEQQERERRKQEKRKYKALYGRKTSKGQPIMKYRINGLLSKIKNEIGRK